MENIVVAYLSLDLQSHYPLIIFQNFRGFTFYTGRSNFYELIFRFLFECFLLVIIINIDPRFIVASLSIGVESVKIIPNLFDQSMNTAFPCDGLPVVLYFLYDNDHSVIHLLKVFNNSYIYFIGSLEVGSYNLTFKYVKDL